MIAVIEFPLSIRNPTSNDNCEECASLRKTLFYTSVAFAETEAGLAGKLPSIVDVSAPYFVNRQLRDQAHTALVEHLALHFDTPSAGKRTAFYRVRSE
jgi:hypothetical protein